MRIEQYRTVKRVYKALVAARTALEDIQADERIKVKYSAQASPEQEEALKNLHNLNRVVPGCDVVISIIKQIIKDNKGVKFGANSK